MPLLDYKLDINDIIKNESITTHFQPVVSVKKKTVVGFEALCRGIDVETNGIIPPNTLFHLAKDREMTLEFDRLCRKKALESYSRIYNKDNEAILFLNLDTSIIDRGVVGSGHLLNTVHSYRIDPGNVVIEIIESKTTDILALNRFIETHKNYGFLIALDDVGAGHSNLDRIPLVKPDVLKIDRSLINNIDRMYYKQEVFKSLVNLSKKIGALVVAEGVEREEEAMLALDLGADMLQGYYFSKPQENIDDKISCIKNKTDSIAFKYRSHLVKKVKDAKSRHKGYKMIIDIITSDLSKISVEHYDARLKEAIKSHLVLECVYILNEAGTQVTDTIFNHVEILKNRKIFGPAKKGTDHSSKDYYYLIVNTSLSSYTTEPYISLASGNLCVTISSLFVGLDGRRFIICVDIRQNYLY
ncbi:EAL domain-containing protein [Pelotomaculum propionicicum]|uniref:Putative EAL-domain containing protein YkuI n=1 Tax=Pelotomaculum propionicicum TaxID=258475 RepID=A0A4Y7RNH0_9FIRM|nr:EAL domain-containing protein [Pelotomaculum propionicicum]TEB10538.1 putative EAL-domain containing protein YkuI [Pelotomaculum propionicicum]